MKKIIFACVFAFVVLLTGCTEYDDLGTLKWTFSDPITDINGNPWKDFDATGEMMNTDAVVNNYMTIMASVSNGTRIRWFPNEPNPYEGFTKGAIQVNGRAAMPDGFLKIGHIQGPFEITMKYTGVGSGNKNIFLRISLDDTPQINGPVSTGIFDPQVLTFSYEKPFPVLIVVGSTDSVKLFDVIITSKAKNKL